MKGIVLILIFCALGCGDDPETIQAVTPPENPERDLLVVESADPATAEAPDVADNEDQDPLVESPDFSSTCCPTNFAIFDRNRIEDEISVTLRGDSYPLNSDEGIALTFENGVWKGSACMPVDLPMFYYYEFEVPTLVEDETFLFTRVNEMAPLEIGPLGDVNHWVGGENCEEIDIDIHSRL